MRLVAVELLISDTGAGAANTKFAALASNVSITDSLSVTEHEAFPQLDNLLKLVN